MASKKFSDLRARSLKKVDPAQHAQAADAALDDLLTQLGQPPEARLRALTRPKR